MPSQTFFSSTVQTLDKLFEKESILRKRELITADGRAAVLYYFDGMVDSRLLGDGAIARLQESHVRELSAEHLCRHVLALPSAEPASSLEEACQHLSMGNALLLVQGLDALLDLDVKKWNTRGVAEPGNERVLQGPREGFTEAMQSNLSLIRRRLPSPQLKVESVRMGQVAQTAVCICYLDDCVDHKVLALLRKRLSKVVQAAVLDSNFITEQIRDGKRSPFQTVGTTERPDIVSARLLEGRVAILCEGSPIVLTVPFLFVELFHSNEDYYVNFTYASFQRVLRFMGFYFSVLLPALYVSMCCFQPELLPISLVISISAARQNVPFSTVVEAVILLVSFDILRESGSRSPSNVGQALSVVSSIVLGQAAIEAGFVGSPILIIAAFAGVTSVLVPNLITVTALYRYTILFYAAVLGYWGCLAGLFHMLLHLSSLESFGVPYLQFSYVSSQKITGDTYFRDSWAKLRIRPIFRSGGRGAS